MFESRQSCLEKGTTIVSLSWVSYQTRLNSVAKMSPFLIIDGIEKIFSCCDVEEVTTKYFAKLRVNVKTKISIGNGICILV